MDENRTDALEKHLKQWNQISERLHKQLEPVRRAQEAFEKAMRPTLELEKAFKSQLEPFLEQQRKLQKAVERLKLPRYQLPDLTHFSEQLETYQNHIRGIISPAFEELQRSFQELPPKIQEALLLIADHGWYIDFNMPLPGLWEIKKAIISGSAHEVEEALVEYYQDQLGEIEESLTKQFPHRAHIVSSAFEAHRNQEYFLSIPVLLAQTDGICKEVIDQYLFMKRNKKPRTAAYVDELAADTYRAALLSPLAVNTPIGASEHEREEGFNHLNRHMVLHGESLNYGSKVNSLKAVSLVNYVSQALKPDAQTLKPDTEYP